MHYFLRSIFFRILQSSSNFVPIKIGFTQTIMELAQRMSPLDPKPDLHWVGDHSSHLTSSKAPKKAGKPDTVYLGKSLPLYQAIIVCFKEKKEWIKTVKGREKYFSICGSDLACVNPDHLVLMHPTEVIQFYLFCFRDF